jgi:hypothetical protein
LDKTIEFLLSWQFIFLSLVIFGFVKAVGLMGSKKDATGKWSGGLYENCWFQRLAPIFPYVVGVGLVSIPGVPLPEEFPTGWGPKILFGLAAAIMSDKTYQIINNLLFKNKKLELPEETPQPAEKPVEVPQPADKPVEEIKPPKVPEATKPPEEPKP